MTVTVDQAKLVLNSFSTILQNNMVSADVVSWKEHDGELDDRNALQYAEQKAPRYAVVETTDGVADLTSGVQGSVFGSEQFKVNKTFNTSMGWGDFVKIRDIGQARESEALNGAATSMAEYIDAYVLKFAANSAANWVGTPGLSIDNQDEVASAYTRLKNEGVQDMNLNAVINFNDQQGLGNQVVNLAAPDAMATQTFRNRFKGMVAGLPTHFTQQLGVLTVGTRAASGAALINGASQNKNYKDVAVSSAPGYFMTQTLTVDGLAASATVKAGEVFTVAGVNAYDNRKGAAQEFARQFTVVADATMDGTGAGTLTIFPAMIVPASGSGEDININTAHATVDAAPADNAAITFLGTASTGYTSRMVIQKQAIRVNTVPLIMPATGTAYRRKLSKVPLSVRMWMHSDFNTGAHSVRFDVALTANVVDRLRVCRFNGV